MGQHLAERWVWSNQKDRASIHIMMMNCWLPTTSSDVIHTQVACQQNEDCSSIWRLSLHKPLMSKEFLRSSSKVGCLSGLLLFDFEPGNHGPLGRLFGPGSANIGTSLRLHLVKHRPHGSQRIRMHGPHLTLFKMQGFNYFVSMSISPATYQRQICWRYPHLFVNAGHIISCEGYKWFYSHHDPAFVWPYPHDCPMLVWRSPAIDAENPLYCQLSWKTLKSCWIAYCLFLQSSHVRCWFLRYFLFAARSPCRWNFVAGESPEFFPTAHAAPCAEDNLSTIVEYWRRCAAATKDDKIRKKHEEDDDHPKGLPSGKHRKSSYWKWPIESSLIYPLIAWWIFPVR